MTKRRHLAWIGVLAMLGSWSYLSTWAANEDFLTTLHVWHFLAWAGSFLLLGVAVTTGIMLVHSASADRAYVAGAIVIFLIQGWRFFGDIHSWLTVVVGPTLAWLVIAVVWIGIVVVGFRGGGHPSTLPTFFVVAIALTSLPAYQTATSLALVDNALAVSQPDRPEPDSKAPDVFIIVVDAYGRADFLEDEFGFNSQPFHTQLASYGVSVVEYAMSNYTRTAFSVGSLLDADYPSIGPVVTPDQEQQLRTIHSGDGGLFKALASVGYETHFFDNAWTYTTCGRLVDRCHRSYWSELDYEVAKNTPLLDVVPRLRVNPWTRTSVVQLRQAARLARTPSETPRLVFLHALIPHAPFHLNESCETFNDPQLEGYQFLGNAPVNNARRADAFIDQVECVNVLLVQLVAEVPHDAILLITGDHGVPHFDLDTQQGDEALQRPFAVFMASRMPPHCPRLKDSTTIVRAAQEIIGCATSTEVVPAPDRHFVWGASDGRQTLTEVTERVRSGPTGGS